MFCRFGSLLLNRPVAATAWLKQVWTRPVSGSTSCGKRVDVRALQLLQRPPLQDQPRHVVRQRQLLEHFDRGRRRLRLDVALEGRQLQLVEENARQLLRRVDVELLAGHLEDLRAARRQLLLDVLRLRRERPPVDVNPRPLDVDEHRDERHLHDRGRAAPADPGGSARSGPDRAAAPDRRARPRSSAPCLSGSRGRTRPWRLCRRRLPRCSAL